MGDSESYLYEDDFDDASLLSAMHEAEAAKRQRMEASPATVGNSVIQVQLPESRAGWPQQTGVFAHAVITELPQTPAGRNHSNASVVGVVPGRPRSEGRNAAPAAPASDPSSSLSLVPVSALHRERGSEAEHNGQRGNARNGQSYGRSSSTSDSHLGRQQQNGPYAIPATPPSVKIPPQPSPQAVAPNNPYFVTHPQATSRPSTPHNTSAGNLRMPLHEYPENQQPPLNSAALALVNKPQAEGQEKPAAASIPKQKELWLDCPRASVFRSFQDEAMQILDQCDYQMLQGKRMIKKTGWRKLGMFFGINYEIKDFRDETDQNGDIIRSKFWVKAIMPNGRYCEATGSCDANEKRFSKPNNDIPATAETRAKTRAVQDLLGIGEWKGHQ